MSQHTNSTLALCRSPPYNAAMQDEIRLKRLKFRANHRGTKEADMLLGQYFAHYAQGWDAAACAWFEALLEELDADILGWAMGTLPVPERWQSALMRQLLSLDYMAAPALAQPATHNPIAHTPTA